MAGPVRIKRDIADERALCAIVSCRERRVAAAEVVVSEDFVWSLLGAEIKSRQGNGVRAFLNWLLRLAGAKHEGAPRRNAQREDTAASGMHRSSTRCCHSLL
jgi:hypothetical protein